MTPGPNCRPDCRSYRRCLRVRRLRLATENQTLNFKPEFLSANRTESIFPIHIPDFARCAPRLLCLQERVSHTSTDCSMIVPRAYGDQLTHLIRIFAALDCFGLLDLYSETRKLVERLNFHVFDSKKRPRENRLSACFLFQPIRQCSRNKNDNYLGYNLDDERQNPRSFFRPALLPKTPKI